MKKNGFTLAEVLITLAIIGVVATLTLPALMTNTTEQQAITAYRKIMNTLNEAAQMSVVTNGFDYGNLTVAGAPRAGDVTVAATGLPEQSLWGLLVSSTQVDVQKSIGTAIPGECRVGRAAQVVFRDGTAFCYTPRTTATQNDTIQIIVDTNGLKGPNVISTCDNENCTGNGKQIKDQFRATLHGSVAVPGWVAYTNGVISNQGGEGADMASRWAMSK